MVLLIWLKNLHVITAGLYNVQKERVGFSYKLNFVEFVKNVLNNLNQE